MTRTALRAWLLALVALFALAAAPSAQDQKPPQEPHLPSSTIGALEALAGLIQEAELRRAEAANDPTRQAKLDQELRDLRWRFGSLASRFDVQKFEAPEQKAFDLQREVVELIQPVVEKLKAFTADSRTLDATQKTLEALQARHDSAQTAMQQAQATLRDLPAESPARTALQWEIQQRWTPALVQMQRELVILQGQKEAQEQARRPLLDQLRDTTQQFLRTSGLSIVLAALVFCGVFFGLRWVQDRLLRRRVAGRATSLRVLEITLATLSVVLAVLAALVVPYVRDDWFLLPICVLILLGLGWVLIKMLPQFLDQIRLVLNIGPVREGERLLIDGLPYRVDQLRFFSRLSNPELHGGVLRVPIQDLIGKRSRAIAADEPWFPCRQGDVVMLGDDLLGPVLVQTPETVVIDDLGAPKSFPTAAFLAANPRNLSHGFAIQSTFGIDYRHQRDATAVIPERLAADLQSGLAMLVGKDQVRAVDVLFAAAGSSSLDLVASATFTGEAAPHYRTLRRALQRIFVESCTQNGWNIPFPQLTVHRADG